MLSQMLKISRGDGEVGRRWEEAGGGGFPELAADGSQRFKRPHYKPSTEPLFRRANGCRLQRLPPSGSITTHSLWWFFSSVAWYFMLLWNAIMFSTNVCLLWHIRFHFLSSIQKKKAWRRSSVPLSNSLSCAAYFFQLTFQAEPVH